MARRANVAAYSELAARILALPAGRSRLVSIDGPGGAGKSVFATRLSRALADAPIVQTDDFATGAPGEDWWPRLERQVIQPLLLGRPGIYQRYDWNRRTLAEWRQVPAAPAVIIDGVSSARRGVAGDLALAVWIHAPRAVRLARGLERDGEDAQPAWKAWMAAEDAHFQADDTIPRCGVLVDGAPTAHHDPEREFVELDSCDYE
jgi:hypothetical protein